MLTVDDLEVFAEEATRQNRSLACLIRAMTDGLPIAWMQEERTNSNERRNAA